MRALLLTLLAAAGLFVAALGLLFVFQRRLLYYPERMTEEAARAHADRLGARPWRIGSRFAGWRLPAPEKLRVRVLVLHGNAGSALDRAHYAAALARFGAEVVLLEYPGYGPRPGSPTEDSLAAAAVEAVEALGSEGAPVWLLGESLGTGVAARAAAMRPDLARALLLVTPYADLGAVGHRHFPFVPAFFLRDRFVPARDLASFRRPVAVLVAGADEVVGPEEGRRLFAALPGPKLLREEPGASHNGVDLSPEQPFWEEVIRFFDANGG